MDLYDGIVEYGSRVELAEVMVRFQRDDRERRRIAERKWRVAYERTACVRVARHVVETCMGEAQSEVYGLATEPTQLKGGTPRMTS